MTHAANLISYGVPFRLLAESPAELRHALTLTPHATGPDPNPTIDRQAFSATDPALRESLMVHVANHAPGYVFLHAGVVALHGKAIVLPGSSFAGKTTLTAALVRFGAAYYSDEYAVLSPEGLIHPYARDLQVRVPGQQLQTPTPVEHFSGHAGTTPVRAALIAFVNYAPHGTWTPTPVTPGMAVLEMLRHAIPVQRTPARVLSTLTALTASASILRSPRGQAEPAARALLALLGHAR